jgi:hypothetical protein
VHSTKSGLIWSFRVEKSLKLIEKCPVDHDAWRRRSLFEPEYKVSEHLTPKILVIVLSPVGIVNWGTGADTISYGILSDS